MSVFSTTDAGLYNGKRDVPVVYSVPQPTEITPYTRPSDWLTMPTVLSTDEKIVLLVAVPNAETNYIAFAVATSGGANFTVDWDDGAGPISYANGTVVNYNFNWNNYSSGTLTTRGYRQALVTITTATTLIGFDMSFKYTLTSGTINNNYSNHVLEAVMAGSFNDFNFGNTGSQQSSWMEQVNVVSAGAGVNYSGSFRYCDSLVSVLNIPNTTGSSHANMFTSCYSLQTIPAFTMESAINVSGMFGNCYNLISVPNFNLPACANISYMFSSCINLRNAPLLTNTNSVTNWIGMFQYCYALTSVPLYDMYSATDTTYMFQYCNSLKTVPLFNLGNVVTTYGMFTNCVNLLEIPPFNLPSCENAVLMFNGCVSLTSTPPLSLPTCLTTASMFAGCTSLLNVGKITTGSSLSTVAFMFSNCSSLLTNPEVTDTTNVTTTQGMFANCLALQSFSSFDTSLVTNTSNMFQGTSSLKSLPTLNTSNVTSMVSMFQSSGITESPTFTSTSNVTNTANMFTSAFNLKNVTVFDTSKVSNMAFMFSGTNSLESLPALDTSNVTTFGSFAATSGIQYFEANINTSKATNVQNMFNNCKNLNSIPPISFANVGPSGASTAFQSCPSLSSIGMTGMKGGTSVSGDMLSKSALETLFVNLGPYAGAVTLVITSNPGTDTALSKTGTFTTGSNVVTMANTVGVSVGTQFTQANLTATVSGTAYANSKISFTSIQADANTLISFSAVGTSNLVISTYYYLSNKSGTGPYFYDVSATPGGTPLTFTAGTLTTRINRVVTAVNANANVTISATPSLNGTNLAITARNLQTDLATFKGYVVTG